MTPYFEEVIGRLSWKFKVEMINVYKYIYTMHIFINMLNQDPFHFMISWADKATLLRGLLTQRTREREREREKKKGGPVFRHPAKSPTMECQCGDTSHVASNNLCTFGTQGDTVSAWCGRG